MERNQIVEQAIEASSDNYSTKGYDFWLDVYTRLEYEVPPLRKETVIVTNTDGEVHHILQQNEGGTMIESITVGARHGNIHFRIPASTEAYPEWVLDCFKN